MSNERKCSHVAFIMDGNGRWAKSRNLPRFLGHKEGCKRVIDIYEACRENNIFIMSLFAFSTENWSRPKSEIDHLFNYLETFFKKEINRLMKDGTKIIVSGDISPIKESTKKVILESVEKTKENNNFIFNICLNYGGRSEIVLAAKKIAEDAINNRIEINQINEVSFNNYLYTKNLPPVDLLIRTSGEQRISNFMLYQLAYAEMVFTKTYWPSFTKDEFNNILKEFYTRDRRFGGIKNE